ncbi:MAG: MarC family protein [Actinobacteria bacterium]|nr:MarC family protein [Actinomycetota bacterium]MCB8997311.1 MarC family protein [Actinomycetota bacterium]MCB9414099.1 MarC family protein [Actinomycetota bacterium]MCB9423621.1 MarC family protein [Actinomycetota bacterium]HRY09552.1 MarC family protein [Candidatus Nanopelagicales bacterium]
MDWRLFGSVFVTLIVIMDPPGIVPIFLGLTHRRGAAAMRRLALQATLTALGVIVGFALFGQAILDYLHVSLPALQASGGLLLLLVALELLMGKTGTISAENEDVNVALVPLGTPLIAGPGAIVAVMLFMQQSDVPGQYAAVALGVLAVHLVLYLAMRYSTIIARVLGTSGITVLTRISGMLLAAIAAQLIGNAVFGFIDAYGS